MEVSNKILIKGVPTKMLHKKFENWGEREGEQSWKKLHVAHAVRADIFFRIEDILG